MSKQLFREVLCMDEWGFIWMGKFYFPPYGLSDKTLDELGYPPSL